MTIDSRNIAGGGTASMSATNGIFNAFNVAGFTARSINNTAGHAIETASGLVTANTLKTIINITGVSGVLSQLSVRSSDATARTLRAVLTIDGIIIFDRTSASFSAANTGVLFCGVSSTTNFVPQGPMIAFTNSAKLEICSNITETDKLIVEHIYQTRTS